MESGGNEENRYTDRWERTISDIRVESGVIRRGVIVNTTVDHRVNSDVCVESGAETDFGELCGIDEVHPRYIDRREQTISEGCLRQRAIVVNQQTHPLDFGVSINRSTDTHNDIRETITYRENYSLSGHQIYIPTDTIGGRQINLVTQSVVFEDLDQNSKETEDTSLHERTRKYQLEDLSEVGDEGFVPSDQRVIVVKQPTHTLDFGVGVNRNTDIHSDIRETITYRENYSLSGHKIYKLTDTIDGRQINLLAQNVAFEDLDQNFEETEDTSLYERIRKDQAEEIDVSVNRNTDIHSDLSETTTYRETYIVSGHQKYKPTSTLGTQRSLVTHNVVFEDLDENSEETEYSSLDVKIRKDQLEDLSDVGYEGFGSSYTDRWERSEYNKEGKRSGRVSERGYYFNVDTDDFKEKNLNGSSKREERNYDDTGGTEVKTSTIDLVLHSNSASIDLSELGSGEQFKVANVDSDIGKNSNVDNETKPYIDSKQRVDKLVNNNDTQQKEDNFTQHTENNVSQHTENNASQQTANNVSQHTENNAYQHTANNATKQIDVNATKQISGKPIDSLDTKREQSSLTDLRVLDTAILPYTDRWERTETTSSITGFPGDRRVIVKSFRNYRSSHLSAALSSNFDKNDVSAQKKDEKIDNNKHINVDSDDRVLTNVVSSRCIEKRKTLQIDNQPNAESRHTSSLRFTFESPSTKHQQLSLSKLKTNYPKTVDTNLFIKEDHGKSFFSELQFIMKSNLDAKSSKEITSSANTLSDTLTSEYANEFNSSEDITNYTKSFEDSKDFNSSADITKDSREFNSSKNITNYAITSENSKEFNSSEDIIYYTVTSDDSIELLTSADASNGTLASDDSIVTFVDTGDSMYTSCSSDSFVDKIKTVGETNLDGPDLIHLDTDNSFNIGQNELQNGDGFNLSNDADGFILVTSRKNRRKNRKGRTDEIIVEQKDVRNSLNSNVDQTYYDDNKSSFVVNVMIQNEGVVDFHKEDDILDLTEEQDRVNNQEDSTLVFNKDVHENSTITSIESRVDIQTPDVTVVNVIKRKDGVYKSENFTVNQIEENVSEAGVIEEEVGTDVEEGADVELSEENVGLDFQENVAVCQIDVETKEKIYADDTLELIQEDTGVETYNQGDDKLGITENEELEEEEEEDDDENYNDDGDDNDDYGDDEEEEKEEEKELEEKEEKEAENKIKENIEDDVDENATVNVIEKEIHLDIYTQEGAKADMIEEREEKDDEEEEEDVNEEEEEEEEDEEEEENVDEEEKEEEEEEADVIEEVEEEEEKEKDEEEEEEDVDIFESATKDLIKEKIVTVAEEDAIGKVIEESVDVDMAEGAKVDLIEEKVVVNIDENVTVERESDKNIHKTATVNQFVLETAVETHDGAKVNRVEEESCVDIFIQEIATVNVIKTDLAIDFQEDVIVGNINIIELNKESKMNLYEEVNKNVKKNSHVQLVKEDNNVDFQASSTENLIDEKTYEHIQEDAKEGHILHKDSVNIFIKKNPNIYLIGKEDNKDEKEEEEYDADIKEDDHVEEKKGDHTEEEEQDNAEDEEHDDADEKEKEGDEEKKDNDVDYKEKEKDDDENKDETVSEDVKVNVVDLIKIKVDVDNQTDSTKDLIEKDLTIDFHKNVIHGQISDISAKEIFEDAEEDLNVEVIDVDIQQEYTVDMKEEDKGVRVNATEYATKDVIRKDAAFNLIKRPTHDANSQVDVSEKRFSQEAVDYPEPSEQVEIEKTSTYNANSQVDVSEKRFSQEVVDYPEPSKHVQIDKRPTYDNISQKDVSMEKISEEIAVGNQELSEQIEIDRKEQFIFETSQEKVTISRTRVVIERTKECRELSDNKDNLIIHSHTEEKDVNNMYQSQGIALENTEVTLEDSYITKDISALGGALESIEDLYKNVTDYTEEINELDDSDIFTDASIDLIEENVDVYVERDARVDIHEDVQTDLVGSKTSVDALIQEDLTIDLIEEKEDDKIKEEEHKEVKEVEKEKKVKDKKEDEYVDEEDKRENEDDDKDEKEEDNDDDEEVNQHFEEDDKVDTIEEVTDVNIQQDYTVNLIKVEEKGVRVNITEYTTSEDIIREDAGSDLINGPTDDTNSEEVVLIEQISQNVVVDFLELSEQVEIDRKELFIFEASQEKITISRPHIILDNTKECSEHSNNEDNFIRHSYTNNEKDVNNMYQSHKTTLEKVEVTSENVYRTEDIAASGGAIESRENLYTNVIDHTEVINDADIFEEATIDLIKEKVNTVFITDTDIGEDATIGSIEKKVEIDVEHGSHVDIQKDVTVDLVEVETRVDTFIQKDSTVPLMGEEENGGGGIVVEGVVEDEEEEGEDDENDDEVTKEEVSGEDKENVEDDIEEDASIDFHANVSTDLVEVETRVDAYIQEDSTVNLMGKEENEENRKIVEVKSEEEKNNKDAVKVIKDEHTEVVKEEEGKEVVEIETEEEDETEDEGREEEVEEEEEAEEEEEVETAKEEEDKEVVEIEKEQDIEIIEVRKEEEDKKKVEEEDGEEDTEEEEEEEEEDDDEEDDDEEDDDEEEVCESPKEIFEDDKVDLNAEVNDVNIQQKYTIDEIKDEEEEVKENVAAYSTDDLIREKCLVEIGEDDTVDLIEENGGINSYGNTVTATMIDREVHESTITDALVLFKEVTSDDVHEDYRVDLIEEVIGDDVPKDYREDQIVEVIGTDVTEDDVQEDYKVDLIEEVISEDVCEDYRVDLIEEVISGDVQGDYKVDLIEEVIGEDVQGNYKVDLIEEIISEDLGEDYKEDLNEEVTGEDVQGDYKVDLIEEVISEDVGEDYRVDQIVEVTGDDVQGDYKVDLIEEVIGEDVQGNYKVYLMEEIISEDVCEDYRVDQIVEVTGDDVQGDYRTDMTEQVIGDENYKVDLAEEVTDGDVHEVVKLNLNKEDTCKEIQVEEIGENSTQGTGVDVSEISLPVEIDRKEIFITGTSQEKITFSKPNVILDKRKEFSEILDNSIKYYNIDIANDELGMFVHSDETTLENCEESKESSYQTEDVSLSKDATLSKEDLYLSVRDDSNDNKELAGRLINYSSENSVGFVDNVETEEDSNKRVIIVDYRKIANRNVVLSGDVCDLGRIDEDVDEIEDDETGDVDEIDDVEEKEDVDKIEDDEKDDVDEIEDVDEIDDDDEKDDVNEIEDVEIKDDDKKDDVEEKEDVDDMERQVEQIIKSGDVGDMEMTEDSITSIGIGGDWKPINEGRNEICVYDNENTNKDNNERADSSDALNRERIEEGYTKVSTNLENISGHNESELSEACRLKTVQTSITNIKSQNYRHQLSDVSSLELQLDPEKESIQYLDSDNSENLFNSGENYRAEESQNFININQDHQLSWKPYADINMHILEDVFRNKARAEQIIAESPFCSPEHGPQFSISTSEKERPNMAGNLVADIESLERCASDQLTSLKVAVAEDTKYKSEILSLKMAIEENKEKLEKSPVAVTSVEALKEYIAEHNNLTAYIKQNLIEINKLTTTRNNLALDVIKSLPESLHNTCLPQAASLAMPISVEYVSIFSSSQDPSCESTVTEKETNQNITLQSQCNSEESSWRSSESQLSESLPQTTKANHCFYMPDPSILADVASNSTLADKKNVKSVANISSAEVKDAQHNSEVSTVPHNSVLDNSKETTVTHNSVLDNSEFSTVPHNSVSDNSEVSTVPHNSVLDNSEISTVPHNSLLDNSEISTVPHNLILDNSEFSTVPHNILLDNSEFSTVPHSSVLDNSEFSTVPHSSVLDNSEFSTVPHSSVLDNSEFSTVPHSSDLDNSEVSTVPHNFICDDPEVRASSHNSLAHNSKVTTKIMNLSFNRTDNATNISLSSNFYKVTPSDISCKKEANLVNEGETIQATEDMCVSMSSSLSGFMDQSDRKHLKYISLSHLVNFAADYKVMDHQLVGEIKASASQCS